MLSWLEQDLAANMSDWLIAFWHHPPYTKGSHDSDREIELVQMRENALPLLEAYGVDLVLTGHSHCYERSFLLHGHYGSSGTLVEDMLKNEGSGRSDEGGPYARPISGPTANQGTVYVVAGSSGQTSAPQPDWPHPAMFESLLQLGSLVLDIDGDRLDVKFLRETGVVEDYFTILKPSRIPSFRITSWSTVGGMLSLTWQAVPGTTYFVQRALGVSPFVWSVESGPLLATEETLSWAQLVTSESSANFYRVVPAN
jgi:hypothetical protein